MKIIFVIGIGSFIGGMLRYLLAQFIQMKAASTFPFGTLAVNIIGCFFIGIVYGLSVRGNINEGWRFFLGTGLLGGFTTFSAFSNETINLLRYGHLWYASAYVTSSVLLGLTATFFGISILKHF